MKDGNDAIVQRLIKAGCNPAEAKRMTDRHGDYVRRVYPDATTKQKAEVVQSLEATGYGYDQTINTGATE